METETVDLAENYYFKDLTKKNNKNIKILQEKIQWQKEELQQKECLQKLCQEQKDVQKVIQKSVENKKYYGKQKWSHNKIRKETSLKQHNSAIRILQNQGWGEYVEKQEKENNCEFLHEEVEYFDELSTNMGENEDGNLRERVG